MAKNIHSPLVVGNWKMNPSTLADARKLFLDTRKEIGRKKLNTQVIVAPPFPFMSELQKLSPSQRIMIASQNVHFKKNGAHTGEVSLPMLQSVGVSAVIVGHSERRMSGESDEEVSKKIETVLKTKTTIIVCIGETKRDNHGNYFGVIEKQLHSALSVVPKPKLSQVVIAYEPVWAIGTGATATPEDVHEMKLFIQKIIALKYGKTYMNKVRILYGGSVKKENAQQLLDISEVNGFLVGGASLKSKEFAKIINIADAYAKRTL